MRLLLINPRYSENFWTSKWALAEILPNKRTMNLPLGLATLAALCPPHWDVEIIDENVEPIPLEPRAEIVGVCGMGAQFSRQLELLAYYRGRGHYVVAGGSYASLCPEHYAGHADTIAAGECEHTWKEFCRDFERGDPKPLYHETGTVALTDSPPPRFDLLKLDYYTHASLQFSRGCPFRCEFCDIIVMFGRKPRVKGLDQVGRELDELRRLEVHNVFFVDDNLIGNMPVARKLLAFLKEYQDKHEYRFCFGAEVTLNLAQHKDLLQAFRDANFGWVFIGIESTDPESLKETLKTQNLHEDILTSVRRVYSYGIDVIGGFIIGFDHDTTETFERQYQFITDAGIMFPMISLLTAFPKTPLHDRLKNDGRLTTLDDVNVNAQLNTNVIPKNMSYGAMADGYVALYKRLLTDREIARRIRNQLRLLNAPNYHGGYSVRQGLGIFWRLIWRGIIPGGPKRIWHFLCTLPWRAPWQLPTVAADWIGALSMKEFAERRLTLAPADVNLERHVDRVRSAIDRYIAAGSVTLNLRRTGGPDLAVCLKGRLDAPFFRRAAPGLKRLLKDTRASVTLHVEALQAHQFNNFERLLRQLARYGDRVHIVVDERLRALVPIDSSVFNLVLARRVD
jgi:radical SAM superfamily enzyme YgiQ (UPF0313 family)